MAFNIGGICTGNKAVANDGNGKNLFARFFESDGGSYYFKALILGLLIMFAGSTSPNMSLFDVLVAMLVYAIVSLIGVLYRVVVRRLRRQYILEESGEFSRVNRKWSLKLGGYFVLFFVSGLAFFLETPKWNSIEWILFWVALLCYYPVFWICNRRIRRELKPKYRKAAAMRMSFYIMGVVLCVVYAIITLAFQPLSYDTLREAFDSVPNLFESAPCALMSEISIVSTFTDGLMAFGLGHLSSYALALVVCEFIVYALVFFGLVNQFGFCLLHADEIKSEFQLLPVDGEKQDEQPFVKKYFVILAALFAILASGLLVLDHFVNEVRETAGHTYIETSINYWKKAAIDEIDGENEKRRRKEQAEETIKEEYGALIAARNEKLRPLIDDYYKECILRVDAYVTSWFDTPQGGFARLKRQIFGASTDQESIDRFRDMITQGLDEDSIKILYIEYQEQLNELEAQYRNEHLLPGGDLESASIAADDLDLWDIFSESNMGSMAQRILPDLSESTNAEDLKKNLIALVEEARQITFGKLGMKVEQG